MQPKAKRVYIPKVKKIFVVIACAFIIVFGTKALVFSMRTMRETGLSPETLFRLAFDSGSSLKSSSGRTSVLLLGVGGGNHEGADLTDTIIILSFNVPKKSVAFLSVPRDVWSDDLKDKVNSAFHYGEEKKKGGGMVLAKATIEDVVGVPLHYAVLIDFFGFQELIDLVGGINVTVPQAFTDKEFPIAGKENDLCSGDKEFTCRYQELHFDAGLQHMDGSRALAYVRSRHAEGDEGTDFARGRRQQDVIVALKQKLVTPALFFSPAKIVSLIRAFDRAVDTDLNIGELATIGKSIITLKENAVQHISLESLFTAPPLWLYGRYVLVPKENYPAIHSYIRKQLGGFESDL